MIDNSYSYTYECVQGSNPPCTSVCPINFKTRDFISKIKKGNFNSAYKEYAKNVIFPGVVSLICNQDCHGICPEKVSVLELEKAVVRYAVKKDPINYNLPERGERIAVIGAGLSGLACAHRLATRKYQVDVFEIDSKLGGSLKEIINQKILDDEFKLQFKYIKYKLIEEEILDLDKLDYDAIYIATGEKGRHFNLLDTWDRKSLATIKQGVFLGGRVTGGSHMTALMHGMIASASIEKYIKVGSMTGQPETFLDTQCKIPIKSKNLSEPIIPISGEYFLKEEAVQESIRCTLCDCTECKERCEFLQHMDLLPRKVESDSQMARSTDEGLFERVGTRMIVSCSVCGHCGSVCPKNINVEEILIESKKFLFESGHYPPPLHDFYIKDMAYALTYAYVAKAAPGYDKATYMFFPGCQMTASNTEHVEMAYSYMLEKSPDTALMLGCCGVPALWAGNHNLLNDVIEQIKNDWLNLGKPKIVTACPTCAKTFNNYVPEFKIISLYEYINENGLNSDTGFFEGKWVVFDPCSSKSFPDMQESIRNIAVKLGAELIEIKDSKIEARCCGMGGHIYPSNPAVFHKMLNASVKESELPYISYCTNCRNVFLSAGKNTIHILDGVFGLKPLENPYHISELRKNRLELKKRMLNIIWGEDFEIMRQEYSINLKISEEIYDKMDRLHISEEDVYQVAEYCEQNNETVFDDETGIHTGHLQIGIITYWIQYIKHEDYLELINVYSHRIMIS